MKIERIESLHADAGRRTFDYLKITTDTGLVGWSEYNQSFGGQGIAALIDRLAPALIGKDPRAYEAHVALLQALRRTAAGGAFQQAIGAMENALIDLKARALGVPVYELLGGPVRERIRLYWSHCGTYRVGGRAELMGVPSVRSLEDLVALGREVVAKGYTALKTNVLLFRNGPPRGHVPGFARGAGFPELNAERYVLQAIREQLAAFREGAGPDTDILVDLNFSTTRPRVFSKWRVPWSPTISCGWRSTRATPKRSATSAPRLAFPSHRVNASSAGASTAPSLKKARSTWPSSTCRGTASARR